MGVVKFVKLLFIGGISCGATQITHNDEANKSGSREWDAIPRRSKYTSPVRPPQRHQKKNPQPDLERADRKKGYCGAQIMNNILVEMIAIEM